MRGALLAVLLVALALGACRAAGGNGEALHARLGEWVLLAPGQAVSVAGLTLRFLEVSHDSRCPEGVRCFWSGVARIEAEVVREGRSQEVALEQRGLTRMARQRVAGYLLEFNLEPYPTPGRAITPDEYRLRLRVVEKEGRP